MNELIKLFKAYSNIKPSLEINIEWDKIADWTISIYNGTDEIFCENDYSLEICSAKAFYKLSKYGEMFCELENIVNNIF